MTAFMDKATLTAAINVLDLEPEAGAAVARLGEDDLRQIDQAILSALDHRWHKAGFIVSGVMIAAPDEHEDLPEVLYELRIRALAAAARIESKGDPQMMKTFEIRLPAGQQAH